MGGGGRIGDLDALPKGVTVLFGTSSDPTLQTSLDAWRGPVSFLSRKNAQAPPPTPGLFAALTEARHVAFACFQNLSRVGSTADWFSRFSPSLRQVPEFVAQGGLISDVLDRPYSTGWSVRASRTAGAVATVPGLPFQLFVRLPAAITHLSPARSTPSRAPAERLSKRLRA